MTNEIKAILEKKRFKAYKNLIRKFKEQWE